MDRPWFTVSAHGPPLGPTWVCHRSVTGLPRVFHGCILLAHGFPIDFSWVSDGRPHGSFMGLSTIFGAFAMVLPCLCRAGLWFYHGPRMDFKCWTMGHPREGPTHGSPMVGPLVCHGPTMVSHGSATGLPWVSHGSPAGLKHRPPRGRSWVSHGFLMLAHGSPMGLV